MTERDPPFLDRHSYRAKRLLDWARILPVLAVMLLLFPLPYLAPAPAGEEGAGLGVALYLFGVWLATVVATALLSWRLRASARQRR